MKEPLLHFLVIGAVLFALYEAVDTAPEQPDENAISITETEVEGLASSFNRTWRRPPNDAELAAMIDDRVREEVLVREAITLGLDQNDAVIRRRLRQKMEFLTSSIVEAMEPEDAKIQAFFETNRDKFKRPGRIALRQVFLGETPEATGIGAALEALESGNDPATVGVRSLIPPELPLSPETVVDGTFGRGFYESLSALPDGRWAGPVRSGYGMHLVFVTERQLPAIPPLDEIRDNVVQAWRAEIQQDLLEDQYRRMRDGYEITLPASGTSDGAAK